MLDHPPFLANTTGITFLKWLINIEHFSVVKVFLYLKMAYLTSCKILQNLEASNAIISAHKISIGFKSGDWAGDSHSF